ncbi:DUF2341 domain-containing protein [Bradyrhizobium aeschynomenes]|uniref:DUF2341 domain-containing protein n=1 Tax=Bradyrhizobium aeschynomenes TaxID=2734909 RepID=UPI0015548147|nr:DUF2341 domain-containing protein [Bradyrhizobium aeschynomenes]NPV19261.1 DUF2341 domain-containing protein [Bradyrhizobium aeschynomenes]
MVTRRKNRDAGSPRAVVKLAARLFGAIAALAILSSPASAWWNDDWQLRKKISIDASASGANVTDPIGTIPVLIRLHPGNFRFSAIKEDGSDLRFVAGDGKTPLKHHIEKYDALLGEALVWVSVPSLASGAKTEIWLYYGNKKAVPNADAKGSYDPDFAVVYHFNERGTPALDSTVWGNNAQSVGQPAEGALIGTGLRLDGRAPLMLPSASSLATVADAGWTLSLWVKPAALQPNAVLFSRRNGGDGILVGLDNGVPFVEVSAGGSSQRSAAAAPIAAASWHHLAVVAASGKTTLYLDGSPYAALDTGLPALDTTAQIGGSDAGATPAAAQPVSSAAGDAAATDAAPAPSLANDAAAAGPTAAAFVGDIDELQISKVARPQGFIRIAAIGQGLDQGKLIAFSVDEETASWLSGYFAVILKSVTLDGWVVIGVLLVMAAISWMVMFDRASYLRRQAKANARFLQAYRDPNFDLAVFSSGNAEAVASLSGGIGKRDTIVVRSSSLYRIYRVAAEEIQRRSARSSLPYLSATSIAAIRAALDGGVVREVQRLNRLMVILTIAISGGPFLGLLGTVVGVMITFAAIAASGDVNVNAIAPGIAAALVATVAGLGVAIPALFGYNYLISRIKDLTGDIQVFVDELVTGLAELHSADQSDRRMAAE